ncbi:hypothetical protein SELMODRAFT_431494 [Selaginella moellendorffii]|uniref:Uncharacterized protein n=1 Tax=Selaginella moellendorffii TaxID=88036 RepID=D8TCU5_SELML|nr:hypothetical protein SELMODRAFT_431494 [Selaginella moellendorffii]
MLLCGLLPAPRGFWAPGLASRRQKRTAAATAFFAPAFASRPYTAVLIVPTGTGACIGGYAGDALPVARALASIVDCLITHPNVLNGAMLYWPMSNALYVEGYALDRFAAGAWGLSPVHRNKVGLVLDAGIEQDLRLRHLQVADAAAATLGTSIFEHVVTDASLQVEKWIDDKTGASTGRIARSDSLLRAVEKLVRDAAIDAVAVVARFPDDDVEVLKDYRQGQGVDALAGVEAVISKMVVSEFHIPCAHAPALAPLPFDSSVSPRSAAEEIGYTFLPSVLAGLSKAPQYVSRDSDHRPHRIWAEDVDAVLVPVNACGGDGVRAFSKKARQKPLIIAVEENVTVLNDTPEKLQIEAVRAANYWEALGVVAAHKAGVNPMALRRDGVLHNREVKLRQDFFDLAEMVMSAFAGQGVGFGIGIGCGFGIGWGFGGVSIPTMGLGIGGGCGVGIGLGWGFGAAALGSQYFNAKNEFDPATTYPQDKSDKHKQNPLTQSKSQ